MKALILIVLALGAGIAAYAEYSLTAFCPLDGERAWFAGARPGTCNYQHQHYDAAKRRYVTHSYWTPCHN
jgi:hypothetical protein